MGKEKFTCLFVDWGYAYELAMDVGERMRSSGFIPEVVVGIARGGWYLARVLCDFFLVRELLSLKMEHWGVTATVTGAAELKSGFGSVEQQKLRGRRVLIADDVTDTGDSIRCALEYVRRFEPADVKTATMHHKTSSPFIPDFYGELMTEWRWIIYPWSVHEDIMQLMEKLMVKRGGKVDLDGIRDAMKEEYDLYIPYHLLREVLSNMEFHGKVRQERSEEDGREVVFWVMQ